MQFLGITDMSRFSTAEKQWKNAKEWFQLYLHWSLGRHGMITNCFQHSCLECVCDVVTQDWSLVCCLAASFAVAGQVPYLREALKLKSKS